MLGNVLWLFGLIERVERVCMRVPVLEGIMHCFFSCSSRGWRDMVRGLCLSLGGLMRWVLRSLCGCCGWADLIWRLLLVRDDLCVWWL